MGLRLRESPRHTVVYQDGDIEAKFFVQVLPEGKVRRIFTKNIVGGRELATEEAKINIGGLVDDKVDAVIVGWEGVEDAQGNPLPCNRSNKILLYDVHPEIIDFVLAEVDKLVKVEEKQKEKELKNLKGGPGGPPSQGQ